MSRLCAQNTVPLPETSVLWALGAGCGCRPDLIRDFGSPTKEAFVSRTDAAFAALAAWDACSSAASAAWKARSEAACRW